MSIQILPFEVLLQIFQNLETYSLVHCKTVCKAWCQPSTQVIYEKIELSFAPSRKLALYENQEAGVNVGTLARSLKIDVDFNPLDQEQFLKLLSYMPHLKRLEIIRGVYSSFSYLEHLSKKVDHCIQHLEYLDFDCILGSRKEMQEYFLVAYSLRNTLKNLYLFSLGNTYTTGGSSIDERSAVEFLNDFPNLTRLKIDNYYGESDQQLSMFHIIQSCPNLTSFAFRSEHPIPEDNGTSKISTKAKPKFTNIKNFALRLPNMTQPQMQHVLSSLPTTTTMNSFKLELYDTPSGMWIQELEKTTLERLGRYLGNVRQQSEFSIAFKNRTTSDTLMNEIPSSLETIAKFFPLIDVIMKYRTAPYCHLELCVSNEVTDGLGIPVKVIKNDRYLFFSYELDSVEVGAHLFQQSAVPEIHALILVPNVEEENSFHQKMISSMNIMFDDPSLEDGRFLDILRLAIDNCPLLETISFTRRYNQYRMKFGCCPETCDACESIRYADFRFESYYGENHHTDEARAINTPKESLQYALLYRNRIQQNTLPLISSLLPHIKVLKLFECEIDKDGANYTAVDIQGINHLQQLVLDVKPILEKKQFILIIVEMENDQVSYFEAEKIGYTVDLSFVSVSASYVYAHNILEAINHSIIIIMGQKIDEIGVCFGKDRIEFLIKPHLNSVKTTRNR